MYANAIASITNSGMYIGASEGDKKYWIAYGFISKTTYNSLVN